MSSRYFTASLISIFMMFSLTVNAQAPQADSLDVLTLRTSPGKGPLLYTSTLHIPSHMEYGAFMLFGMGIGNPFVINNVVEGSVDSVRSTVVSMIGMAEVGGYLGIMDKYMLGLSIPVGFIQGNKIDDEGIETESLSPLAWGDLTVHAKGMITKVSMIDLGFDVRIGVPTGKYSDNFTGEAGINASARVLSMIKMGKFGAAAELGFIYRPFADDSSFFGDKFQQGNQVVFGAGGWFRVLQQLHITAEISGRSGFSNNRHDHPLEGGVGASYEVMSGLYLQAGINVGIISGMGTPPFRVLFGVKWAPSFKDSDGDGVVDEQDKCPLIKEDKDGFEDEDGCPDPDNDKDGIPDVTDKCPNQAEDIDGFEDEDGCPDYDNDKDGIPDIKDNCPKDPGPKSKNGCPASHIDTDGDGVSDSVDKCPKDPGEKRYMGCTRETYDGDGDGVMDSEDKCPKHPGEAKYKGCPASMVDTDEDGVTDDKDKCPGKMETINGYKDDDGCPDKGKPWFSIAQIKILGMEKTGLTFKFPSRKAEWFENKTGGTLTKEGKNALGQFVLFMKSKKAIPKMALMILTDNTMSGDAAMKITKAQGEAVKKYVVSMGLSAARVVIQPMGNQIPAYKGKNRKKQIRNRRILFIILEN